MRREPWNGTLLALDIATELGWAAGATNAGSPIWGTHRLPSGGSDARACIAFEEWLERKVAEVRTLFGAPPVKLVIETPPRIVAFKGQTNAGTLMRLNSLARKADEVSMRMLDGECTTVEVGQWRKRLTGSARYPKRGPYPPIDMLLQLGWDVKNHNAADAIGVWLYALGALNPDVAVAFDPLVRRAALRKAGRK